jgi:hypothetical protein
MAPGSGSEMNNNIPDHITKSLETSFGLKILQFFYADPGSRIRFDPGSGMEKFVFGINISDPQQ